MKIYWIAPGLPETTDLEQITLASHRYRVMMPAQALQALGHEVTFQNLLRATAPETLMQQKPDVLIVGKLLPSAKVSLQVMAERLFVLLEQARNMAIPVIADINDDHFNHPSLGKLWQQLLKACTAVVSGSAAMQSVVQNYCQAGQLRSVVGDPVATPRGTAHCWQVQADEPGLAGRMLQRILPKTAMQRRLHLLWYGNPGNWPAVERFAQHLAGLATTQPFIFEIVSAMEPRIEMFVDTFNERYGAAACMDLFPWSTETLSEAMARADLVVIPADVEAQGKNVKTANRLIDALYAGRFVVAAPVPSYQEFADFSWQGSDLLEGIQFCLQHPEVVLQKVQAGQAYIAQHYAAEAIARVWEAVIQQAIEHCYTVEKQTFANPFVNAAPAFLVDASPAMSGNTVRLNLGCGDKILPGYINVDVAPSRRGLKPDVLCDLRDLSVFPDNYADEILSVHVVEHFWRWEVEAILKEWLRVLKPGGRMVIECPNLLSACQTLLDNPESACGPGPEGQRSMWVFYGDPAWQDPLMIHRWGYTPYSLKLLLEGIGLVSVQQTPAQYKLREPRDMRLEGCKKSP